MTGSTERPPLPTPRPMARILAALALLVSVIGCSDDSEANEARLLLDRLENVQTPDLRQWR